MYASLRGEVVSTVTAWRMRGCTASHRYLGPNQKQKGRREGSRRKEEDSSFGLAR